MNSLVHNLEELLLPQFDDFSKRIVANSPRVNVRVHSHAFESRGGSHLIAIECLIPEVAAYQSDNVGLSVEIYDLRSSPKLNADVCWGHPSGYIEDSFGSEEGLITETTLVSLKSALPRLLDSLQHAINRSKPNT